MTWNKGQAEQIRRGEERGGGTIFNRVVRIGDV